MPLIIDTFNVLHTVGVLPPELAGIDVQGLIGLIKKSRYRNEKVILACDGKPQPDLASREPNVTIRFSGAGKPADDLIGQLVRMSSAPRRLIVVSTDHAVQRTARRRRCVTLTSEQFLSELAEDANLISTQPQPNPKSQAGQMTAAQIEKWIEVFDLDETNVDQLLRGAAESHEESSGDDTAAESESIETTRLEDQSSDDIKPVLPPSLIEQAERLWREQSPPNKSKDKPASE